MELMAAETTKSLYFSSPKDASYLGKRFPAGTYVEVWETTRGIKAVVREGYNRYFRYITLEDVNPNI